MECWLVGEREGESGMASSTLPIKTIDLFFLKLAISASLNEKTSSLQGSDTFLVILASLGIESWMSCSVEGVLLLLLV